MAGPTLTLEDLDKPQNLTLDDLDVPASPARPAGPLPDYRTIMASPEFQKGAVAPFKGAVKGAAKMVYDTAVQGGGPITQFAGWRSGANKAAEEATAPSDTGEQAGQNALNAAMLVSAAPGVGGAINTAARAVPAATEGATSSSPAMGAVSKFLIRRLPGGKFVTDLADLISPAEKATAARPLSSPAAAPAVDPYASLPAGVKPEIADALASNFHGKTWGELSDAERKSVTPYLSKFTERPSRSYRPAPAVKTPESTVAPAQPSPNGTLTPPITAKTPEAYTKKALDQIVSKAEKSELDKHQNEFHVGDVSEHKALNVARYLNEQGVTADAYQKLLDTAKQTGDWSPIDRINNEAYKTGVAGGYNGYLPKNGYSAVSDARRVQRSSYQGTTTPQRIIEHLKEFDKLRK